MTPLALFLTFQVASASAPHVVRFEVGAPAADPQTRVHVTATWLGEERTVELVDNGTAPGDVAGDGVWVGQLSGEPVSLLPLEMWVQRGGDRTEAWAGVEPVAQGEDRLTWALDLSGEPRATRVSAPATARRARASEAADAMAPVAWACFVLIYVAWLVERSLREAS